MICLEGFSSGNIEIQALNESLKWIVPSQETKKDENLLQVPIE